MYHIAM